MLQSTAISNLDSVSANDAINNNVEIVVHINQTLDGITRNGLQAAILEDNGIFSVEFCPLRYHLLLVQYDRRKLNSRDVLSKVVAQNLSAQIVGPI